jgi:LPXTG-motif cell wall-anchored protein
VLAFKKDEFIMIQNPRLNKLLVLFGISLIFLTSYNSVKAIDATPNSGSFPASQTVTLFITSANPMPTGVFNTAHLNFHITGGTIINYIPPTGTWTATGYCNGTTTFTTDNVCVTVTNTTDNIAGGVSLGQVFIQLGTVGTTVVTRGSGTGYETSSPFTPYLVGSNLVSFIINPATNTPTPTLTTIVTNTNTPTITISTLPKTSSDNSDLTQIIVAVLFIGLGLWFYRVSSLAKAELE